MTRARFFFVAAACLAAATPAAAQYAAAVAKAHTTAAATSARSGQTDAVQRQVAQSGAPANAAAPAAAVGAPKPSTTAQPMAEAPESAGPKGFAYNPEGRRDPFVSLVRRGTDAAANTPGPRKPGLPGLGVGEVTLKGTMASRGGYLGLLRGADAKTYIVRPGDRLLDGTVQAVTIDAVVILQHVDDPISGQKEREVRKTLRQTEEEAK
jgi:Tfp pilus assembly protein PilP